MFLADWQPPKRGDFRECRVKSLIELQHDENLLNSQQMLPIRSKFPKQFRTTRSKVRNLHCRGRFTPSPVPSSLPSHQDHRNAHSGEIFNLNRRSRRGSMGRTYSHCAVHPVRSGTNLHSQSSRSNFSRIARCLNNPFPHVPSEAFPKGRRFPFARHRGLHRGWHILSVAQNAP